MKAQELHHNPEVPHLETMGKQRHDVWWFIDTVWIVERWAGVSFFQISEQAWVWHFFFNVKFFFSKDEDGWNNIFICRLFQIIYTRNIGTNLNFQSHILRKLSQSMAHPQALNPHRQDWIRELNGEVRRFDDRSEEKTKPWICFSKCHPYK